MTDTITIAGEIRGLIASVESSLGAPQRRRLDDALHRIDHALGAAPEDDSGPFFPDACGGPGDGVRDLTDEQLQTAVRHLVEVMERHKPDDVLHQYPFIIAAHPQQERNRRWSLLHRHRVELQGGHNAVVTSTPRDGVEWIAECFCGWEGPDRDTEAEADAEAHMAPHIPAWLREDAS